MSHRNIRNMSNSEERSTVVNRLKLIDTLKSNMKDHIAEYESAVEGYLQMAQQKISKKYKEAQRKLDDARDRTLDELKRFDPTLAKDTIVFCEGISFHLPAPRNYADAYEQAIEMMEWDTRDEVELNLTEFRCFVMNKWDWMDEFKSVSMSYTS